MIQPVNFTSDSTAKKQTNIRSIGVGTALLAYLGGDTTSFLINTAYQRTLNNLFVNGVAEYAEPSIKIGEVLDKALEKSNLKNKGTKIFDISKLSNTLIPIYGSFEKKQIVDCIKNEYQLNPLTKKLANSDNKYIKKIMNKYYDILSIQFLQSKNAAYFPHTNIIMLDSLELGYAGFHEIGHAVNLHFSKIGKTLQKMRVPLIKLATIIPAAALLTNKRTNDNPPQNIWQKTTTFIKENVGKLTTLAFVPIITEEIMASVKGKKLANTFLPEKFLKNVTKSNTFGAASYICTAIFAGVAAYAGNKVRDKIVDKKLEKQ